MQLHIIVAVSNALTLFLKALKDVSSVIFMFFCSTFQAKGAERTKAFPPSSVHAYGTESNNWTFDLTE